MPLKAQSSTFLRTRFADPAFWRAYLRAPGFDLGEGIIRLRRLRGWSQEELALKLSTKQPAVARLESGSANPRLSTLVALGEALDATVRLSLEPMERIPSQEWFLANVASEISSPSTVVSVEQSSDSFAKALSPTGDYLFVSTHRSVPEADPHFEFPG